MWVSAVAGFGQQLEADQLLGLARFSDDRRDLSQRLVARTSGTVAPPPGHARSLSSLPLLALHRLGSLGQSVAQKRRSRVVSGSADQRFQLPRRAQDGCPLHFTGLAETPLQDRLKLLLG